MNMRKTVAKNSQASHLQYFEENEDFNLSSHNRIGEERKRIYLKENETIQKTKNTEFIAMMMRNLENSDKFRFESVKLPDIYKDKDTT